MQQTVNVADVQGAEVDYEKAFVVITDQGFTVMDRRRNVLAEVPVGEGMTPHPLDQGRRWTMTAADGTVWTLNVRSGCGCGGTKVIPKN